MPTELEELVEFLHHGNTQIRQIATENLVPFSKAQPDIFKTDQLRPVKDLKILVRDYAPIAKNAVTILINISSDGEVLKSLAEDDTFLGTILGRLTNPKESTADDIAMLLANLSKSSAIQRLIPLERSRSPELSPSKRAITQLIELFNRGANKGWNREATFDYLAYVFADLAKYLEFAKYLTTPPSENPLDTLTLFLPHTTHSSPVRRLGIASLLKNIALIHPDILYLLQPAQSVLPPLLLPLCSSNQEGLSEEEMDSLPEECQYLAAEHNQERDLKIIKIHLETLWLLATRGGLEGRRIVKERGTYPVIRELHLQVGDEGARRACERIVETIMGDEVPGGSHEKMHGSSERKVLGNEHVANGGRTITQPEADEDEDEDNAILPIF